MRESCYDLARRALAGSACAMESLKERLESHPIIACDFDGTLCRSVWPEIGEECRETLAAAKLCASLGARLILWSCRELDALEAAVEWCGERGLRFAAVNDNPQEIRDAFGVNSRKIYADEYWDDKAVAPTE